MAKQTANYQKHTGRNPLQKLLISNFYKTLLALIKDLETEKILDAGSGEGFTLNILAREGIGKKLEGVDSSREAVALGKKLHPKLELKLGNIYKLPYPDKAFDLIICTEVLEHLEDPEKAFKELMRASKKYLLLSVPNEPLFRLANFLRGKNIKRFGNDKDHLNHWSGKSFAKFVEKEKIKIIKVKTPFPWVIILAKKG